MRFGAQIGNFALVAFLFVVGAISSPVSKDSIKKVYQFPGPPNSFLENILVLNDTKDTLILTDLFLPQIYVVFPLEPNRIHITIPLPEPGEFSLGIAQPAPNEIYFLAAANLSIAEFSVAKESKRLYQLNLTDYSIAKFLDLPKIGFPNGLDVLNDHTLLAADSVLGAVWSIDLSTKKTKIVAQDPLMLPSNPNGTSQLGIDGIKIRRPHHKHEPAQIIFSNENTNALSTIPVCATKGKSLGAPARVIAWAVQPSPPTGLENFYDDFCLSRDGKTVYSSTGYGDSLVSIDLATGAQCNLTTNTDLPLWVTTSAALSKREEGVVYGITTGGQPGPSVEDQVGSLVYRVRL